MEEGKQKLTVGAADNCCPFPFGLVQWFAKSSSGEPRPQLSLPPWATCVSSSSTEISLDTLLTMRATHTHKFLCGNFCTQFTVDCHKSQHGWASSRLLLLILLFCCCLLCPNAVVYFWTRFSSCVPFSLLSGKLFTFDAAEERSLKVAQNNYRYI